jgi:hypothetical protein
VSVGFPQALVSETLLVNDKSRRAKGDAAEQGVAADEADASDAASQLIHGVGPTISGDERRAALAWVRR